MNWWRTLMLGTVAVGATISSAPVAKPAEAPASAAHAVLIDPRVVGRLSGTEWEEIASHGVELRAIDIAAPTAAGKCLGMTEARQFTSVEAQPAERIETLGRFNPDFGLRQLAKRFVANGQSLHVVLVAGGASECVSVGCSLTSVLAADGGNLRIDVIALNAASDPLRCLASNTGGKYQTVGDGPLLDEIAAVLQSESVAAASAVLDASREPAARLPPLPLPRPEEEMVTTLAAAGGKQNLDWVSVGSEAATPELAHKAQDGVSLQAVAGAEGPPIVSDVSFEILVKEGSGAYRLIARSGMPDPFFPLAPREYVARVTYGDIVREFPFAYSGEGIDVQRLSLDIGYLRLISRAAAHAPLLESGVTYTVSRLGEGPSGAAMTVRRDAQALVALPAGRYRILIQSGAARSVVDTNLAAGQIETIDTVLDLGYLRVNADTDRNAAGVIRIEAAEDGKGNRPKLQSTTTEASTIFRLPAGSKTVTLSNQDRAPLRQRVTVEAGTLHTLNLN
jgi:hypothetical protein